LLIELNLKNLWVKWNHSLINSKETYYQILILSNPSSSVYIGYENNSIITCLFYHQDEFQNMFNGKKNWDLYSEKKLKTQTNTHYCTCKNSQSRCNNGPPVNYSFVNFCNIAYPMRIWNRQCDKVPNKTDGKWGLWLMTQTGD
jgi:hypothetical protein